MKLFSYTQSMAQFIHKLFTKRSLLGCLLMLILIGEPTVGQTSGLFTPGGIVVFFFLYLSFFHLLESLIVKYHLVIFQVILLTFVLYSVLITGFLNKELTEYILKPNPFITLIRIQASFFAAFAFYLLNQIAPRDEEKVLSVKQALIFFLIFVLIISITGVWGFPSLIFTLKTVPGLSLIFIFLALIALFFSLKSHPVMTNYFSKKLNWVIYIYLLLGIIPSLSTFITLVLLMIPGGIYLLLKKNLRNSPL
jgi:hypothetical protein